MSQLATTMNTVLALLLGVTGTLALIGSEAVGYPTGAVSVGVNPVVSQGGAFSDDGTAVLFSADEGGDIVVTDVVLSMSLDNDAGCLSSFVGSLMLSGGGKLAEMAVGLGNSQWASGTLAPIADIHFTSGLRVPAGDTLTLHTNRRYSTGCGDEQMHYTVSGYKAQP